ncbi:hypothetical protein [Streptomyces cyaneus]|uniref:hypothetical protein n=1 Tax=Streptomyces cyaneus TaxID=1904 RepID=UPI000FF88F73|nr:hypothetical protein [Streptomyces cyaneus]
MITHATPTEPAPGAGLRFDRTTRLGVLPIALHNDDGPPQRAALFLDCAELLRLGAEIDAILDQAETGGTVIPLRIPPPAP